MDRIVVILRGPPGAGKTTYAKEHYPSAVICSTDFWRTDPSGVYRFDPSETGEASRACFKLFRTALEAGYPVVCVDKCNLRLSQVRQYATEALKHGYTVKVVRLKGRWPNVHGVAAVDVQAMAEKVEAWAGEVVVPNRVVVV